MSPEPTHPSRPAPLAGAGSRPKLKVLGFGWEFAPLLSGGLGVACAGLGRALVADGVDLTFVLPKFPGAAPSSEVRLVDARAAVPAPAGFPTSPRTQAAGRSETLRIETPLTPYQTTVRYEAALRSVAGASHDSPTAHPEGPAPRNDEALYGGDLLAEVERVALAARRIAADVEHDVIHCHDWMTFAAGIAAREVSGKPLVVHVHSTESDRSGGCQGNPAIRRHEEAGLLAADLVVTVSDFTRRQVLEQYPQVPADRLRVIHNGIEPFVAGELETPAIAASRPVVLFLGRLTVQKGPEWFLRAAAIVHRVRPDALFVVAGTGELLPWMIERVAELGLASSFLFTGFLSGDDIARAYSMADVFIMPSVSEPFGLVPVEAMLRGTPVIVSRQSGVSEVIRHCLKVDFWDTDDLADKIVGVLEHPSLAGSLATAGLREASNMGWQGPARRLVDVFAEVCPKPCEPFRGESS